MFSGLTNQVSSWIGAAKGEPQDEEVPVPANSNQTAAPVVQPAAAAEPVPVAPQQDYGGDQPVAEVGDDGEKKQSPTKAGGMFSNVKSQMSGWLGSASIPSMPAMPAMPAMPSMPAMSIPSIPGLRKTGAEGEAAGEALPDQTGATEANLPGTGGGVDEDDKSRYISATEGADSRPMSGGGTPTEEHPGQIGNVTTKVTQGAKTFGSFLYSAVNKAGAKIKETVKDNEAFIKGQASKAEASVAPWVGHNNEEKIKEEILGLSQDRRNFVRAPPAGVDFQFDYDVSYPVAVAIMTEDPALEKMRFELVPKIITEENFWRNYFYRVSLICQAGDLGTLGADGSLMGGPASSEDASKTETNSNLIKANEAGNSDQSNVKSNENQSGFVSDIMKKTETGQQDIEDGIRKLGIDSLAHQAIDNEEQWEKDLEAELQEYEVVNDSKSSPTSGNLNDTATTLNFRNKLSSNTDWEQDVDDILLSDTDDLK